MRVFEVASLRVEQLVERYSGHFLLVTGKNEIEAREALLSREARQRIERWLQARRAAGEEVPYIFTGFEGRGERMTDNPISIVGAWKVVQRYSDEVGLVDVKPHDFRRFVGTQLAKTDIRKTQKALGQKRIDMTAAHYVLDELEPNPTDDLY
jgi:integrase